MRIVFDPKFHRSGYSSDPFDNAAVPDRLTGVMDALRNEGRYDVISPRYASREDLLRAHTEDHVNQVALNPTLFDIASLAAGATIEAARCAHAGEAAFACVRPPGHHASRGSAWGHCTFSNAAVAVLNLRDAGLIGSATIVDFDQHTGDGTLDVLKDWRNAHVINPYGDTASSYLQTLESQLAEAPQVDILAVCAGFDGYIHDLGRKLSTPDYFTIGRLLQAYAIRLKHQRRFAVLEGGYYLPDLGKNVLSFCRGFE